MAALLTAERLTLEYGGGASRYVAVDEVEVELEEQEFIAVVGPSGSGKSSLLYLLSGLRQPTAGIVAFRGRPFTELGAAGVTALRRSTFGFIFQQHFLVNYLGALENVMVGALHADAATRSRGIALLEHLGLGDKLSQRPYQLSVGERQRVAVARAMVSEPAVIFADEPTASLDQRTGHDVVELLGDYRQRGAVVVVTHDIGMTSGCDRVLEMRDGRLATN
jgi:putative ABC transport system ATP-binding protein